MMRLIVDDVWTYIQGHFPARVIDDETSYKIHGRWYAKTYKRGHWDGIKRFREFDRKRKLYRFPTGFLARVTKALDAIDYPYALDDSAREFLDSEAVYEFGDIRLDQGIYSYQGELLDAALAHGRGIIKAATGAGKTEIGGGIFASYGDAPCVWLTHRLALLHQTRDRLAERLQQPIGIIGDGRVEPQRITVAMVQTLNKRKGEEAIERTLQQAKVVIGDEVHHLESESWFGVFSRLTAPHRFGLTATACTDGAGISLIGMTGEIIAEINAKELIERGVLVQPKIWFTRVPGEGKIENAAWQTVYSKGIVHSVPRNEQIVHVARVFASEKKNGVTLVRRINHGNLLADMMCRGGVRAQFLHGKVSKDDRARMLDQLWDGKLDQVVAQDQILGEGVDMPLLATVINASGMRGGGSARNSAEHEVGRGTIQFLGRGLRRAPGKAFFEYVDISDRCHKFLSGAARERVRALEDEGYASWIGYWGDRVGANAVCSG